MSFENQSMIMCDGLVKIYKAGNLEVVALQGLDLKVDKGEMMAVIGNSGSGKSTLLNILGGLDKPSAGRAEVAGLDIVNLSPVAMRRYKSETVGFVWQNNARNLIPYLTAIENVELPMSIRGKKDADYAKTLLGYVGLSDKMNRKLFELSGGEQQRVAIAIALSNRPPLILADEPTGAVDTKTTGDLLRLFKKVSVDMGVTIIIVTHDRQVSSFVDRVVAIRDGRTSSEFIRRRYRAELDALEIAEASHENTHEEYAVLDKAGRLQIPQAYVEEAGLRGGGRVKLTCEDGKIVIQGAQQDVAIQIS